MAETRCTVCADTNLPCQQGHTGRVLAAEPPGDLVALVREWQEAHELASESGWMASPLRRFLDAERALLAWHPTVSQAAMANPPPGSTAAIREALERVSELVSELAQPDGRHETGAIRALRASEAHQRLAQAQYLLASLSPEAAPVPAAMPQIEVGDVVSGFDGPPATKQVGNMGAQFHNAHPQIVLGIERDGVVIWRRAEVPRP